MLRPGKDPAATTLLVVLLISSCDGDSGVFIPAASPADPPWGLETVDLPDDRASLRATFDGFPDNVAGHDRIGAGARSWLRSPVPLAGVPALLRAGAAIPR